MNSSIRIERQAQFCSDLMELRSVPGSQTRKEISAYEVIDALEQFSECCRYLNTRRSTGAVLNLEKEADVQDALFLMLRPWIVDLIYENPTDKIGNRYSIKDFLVVSAKTVIEVKYIRDENHGKQIAKEIHDDIETYRHHPMCENIIFFIYDAEALIPDVAALRREIVSDRTYNGKALHCHLVVQP